jgi:hypothetical protein
VPNLAVSPERACPLFSVFCHFVLTEEKLMNQQKRMQVLVGVLLAAAVFAAVFLTRNAQSDGKPPPSASGYYTGPMKNKWGTTTTEDGKLVPQPGESTPAQAGAPGAASGASKDTNLD